jgi:predicted TIM-barrel fold metal-dependent hydrolase
MNDSLDWMISVDNHAFEPPDLWETHLPVPMRDRAPRMAEIDGTDIWLIGERRSNIGGVLVRPGREDIATDLQPVRWHELRPEIVDPVARIADMDRDHTLAQLNFPFAPRTCGQALNDLADKDLALACIEVWNDWSIDEWAGAVPGRYMSLMIIPMWDPLLAAREIERCAAKGVNAISFSENPAALGLPSIHDQNRYWDPVFAAASDAQLPLSIHLGSSSIMPVTSDDAPLTVTTILSNMNMAAAVVDWLYSGNLVRFDGLQLVFTESGTGWVPYLLERCEHVSRTHRYFRGRDYAPDGNGVLRPFPADPDLFPDDPISLFRTHMSVTFIADTAGCRLIDLIGVDNVMFETDYPHSDTMFPHSQQVARESVAHLSDQDAFKVLRGNAMRVFNFRPAAPGASVISLQAEARSVERVEPAVRDAGPSEQQVRPQGDGGRTRRQSIY